MVGWDRKLLGMLIKPLKNSLKSGGRVWHQWPLTRLARHLLKTLRIPRRQITTIPPVIYSQYYRQNGRGTS